MRKVDDGQPVSGAELTDDKALFEVWASKEGSYDLRPAKVKMLSVRGEPYDGYIRPFLQDRTVHTYQGFVAGVATARALLSASGQASQIEAPVNVPSGWKLVPVKPTFEMSMEASRQCDRNAGTACEDIYAAMLAAAPAPVAAKQTQPVEQTDEEWPDIKLPDGYRLVRYSGIARNGFAVEKTEETAPAQTEAQQSEKDAENASGLLDECLSSHGPEGCNRVRCQLGKKCAAPSSTDEQRLDAMESMTPDQCFAIIEDAAKTRTLRAAIDAAIAKEQAK